jgi:hypothetical protein
MRASVVEIDHGHARGVCEFSASLSKSSKIAIYRAPWIEGEEQVKVQLEHFEFEAWLTKSFFVKSAEYKTFKVYI